MPDAIVDLGLIAVDIASYAYNKVRGCDTSEDISSLKANALGLFIPGVTGLGLGIRAVNNSSTATKPLLGNNPRVTTFRTNTDLLGGKTTAKSIFRNQTKGQKVEQFQDKNGTIRRRTENGIQIRMNSNGSTRLDLPGRGARPNGETVHFYGE